MRFLLTFVTIVACTISCCFSNAQEILTKGNTVIKRTVKASELNSFASIRACRPWRVISAQTWLAGILILLSFPNAFAESDFSAFWREFKSAVIAGDKAKVAGMTKFPLSMSYMVKAVKNKEDFLRRYNEIFKGEANAAQCFGKRRTAQRNRPGVWDLLPFQGYSKRLGKRTDSLHF